LLFSSSNSNILNNFLIFVVKFSVELMMCVSDSLMRDCSSWVRKREKSYDGKFMALTISLERGY